MALTQISSDGMKDGSIVNADVKSDAAIAGSKLADDSIAEVKLDVSNSATDGNFLQYKDSTDKLTWASASDATKMPLAGGTFTGDVTFDNGTNAGMDMVWDESDDTLKLNDDVQLSLGTGRDMRFYHTGSHGYLNVVTGDLNIRTNSSESAIVCTANAGVALYYDNSKKLETTNAGGTLTGTWSGVGKVLQVAQVIKTDTWSESSVAEGGFSAVVSGLTQSFTCSSTSNKVLIQGSLHVENPVGGGWGVGAVITADGSTIDAATGDARGSNRTRLHAHMPTGYLGGPLQLQYLHSPSSTSAITYGVKLWNGHTSAQNLALNYGSSSDSDVNNSFTTVSTLTFTEIAG